MPFPVSIPPEVHRDNLAVSLAAAVIQSRQIADVKAAVALFMEVRAAIKVTSEPQDESPPPA